MDVAFFFDGLEVYLSASTLAFLSVVTCYAGLFVAGLDAGLVALLRIDHLHRPTDRVKKNEADRPTILRQTKSTVGMSGSW